MRKIVISILVFVLVFSELNIFVAESIVGDPTEPEIECEEQLESDGEENLATECKEQLESENGEAPITEGKEQPETENGETPTTEGKEQPESENGEDLTTEGEKEPETENGEAPSTEGQEQPDSETEEENLANACETQPESETEENLATEEEEQLESVGEEDLVMDCEEEEEPETEEKPEVDCKEEFYIEGEELVTEGEEQLGLNSEEELVTEEEEQLGSNSEDELVTDEEQLESSSKEELVTEDAELESNSEEKTGPKCKMIASPRAGYYGIPVSEVGPIGKIDLSQLDDSPNELDGFTQMKNNEGLKFREAEGRKYYMYFGNLDGKRTVDSLEVKDSYKRAGDDWGRPLPDANTKFSELANGNREDYMVAQNFAVATALGGDSTKENGVVTYYYLNGMSNLSAGRPDKHGNGLVIAHGRHEDDEAQIQSAEMPLLKLYKNEITKELIAYAAVLSSYPREGYVEGYVKIKMSLVNGRKGRVNVSMKFLKLTTQYSYTNIGYSVHMNVGVQSVQEHDGDVSNRLYSLGNQKGLYFYASKNKWGQNVMHDGQDYYLYFFRDGYANPPAAFKLSNTPIIQPFRKIDNVSPSMRFFTTLNAPGISDDEEVPKGEVYSDYVYHPGWAFRWKSQLQQPGEVREANFEMAVSNRSDAQPEIQLDNDGEYTDGGYRITGTRNNREEDTDRVELYYKVGNNEPKKIPNQNETPSLNTDVPWAYTIPIDEVKKGLDHDITVYAVAVIEQDNTKIQSNIETIKIRPKLEITEQVFDESDKKDPTEVAPGETLKYEISVDTGYIADDEGTYGQFTISQKYDPHLEPPTDLKITDGSGYKMGEATYNAYTATIEAKPYTNLPRPIKVKVTFKAKVRDDAAEGDSVVGQATAAGKYSTGDEVNKTSNELKTLISGVLKFVSAPEVIGFGEKLTISPRTKTYQLSHFDERLAVKDSRTLSRNPSWKMTVKLVRPLTGGNNKDSILDGLYYHYGGTVSALTEDTSALVYEKKTTNKEEINISNTWTPEGDGLYLEVPAGTAKVGGYEGTIKWTLQNVPPNEE